MAGMLSGCGSERHSPGLACRLPLHGGRQGDRPLHVEECPRAGDDGDQFRRPRRRIVGADRDGNFADIVLGHDNLGAYVDQTGERFLGATIGRYGNRIAARAIYARREGVYAASERRPQQPARRCQGLRHGCVGCRRGDAAEDRIGLPLARRRSGIPREPEGYDDLRADRRQQLRHHTRGHDRPPYGRQPHAPLVLQPARGGRAADQRP